MTDSEKIAVVLSHMILDTACDVILLNALSDNITLDEARLTYEHLREHFVDMTEDMFMEDLQREVLQRRNASNN